MISRRNILGITGAMVTLAATAGCNVRSDSVPAKREKVSLILDWTPNTNHTGLYVAQHKGYFEDENLAFEIVEPAASGGTQVVATGQADFGIDFQEFMTPARAAGVPVVSVAAIIQENTSGFASLKSKGISRPRDFEGKTYGGWGSPLETALLKTMMEADGGDFSKLSTVDAGAADFLTIIQREVDLYWIYYGWQGVKAELEGVDIETLFVNDWGVPNYYTPLIITSESLIAEKPDTVSRTMDAIYRGYTNAIEDPVGAAEILSASVPEVDADLVGPSQAWLSPHYQGNATHWGYQDGQVWQAMSEWMAENSLVDKLIDWDAAFTNDFLPDHSH